LFRFATGWVAEQFQKQGTQYRVCDQPKSTLYSNFLPLINSGKVELLDNQRLINQLLGLERRTARSGRDSIDHAPHAHDDLINSAAGCIVTASRYRRRSVTWGRRDSGQASFLRDAVPGSLRVYQHRVIED